MRDAAPAAAFGAAPRRADVLERGRDFVTGTVFSHPSDLDPIADARGRGFTMILLHVDVHPMSR